MDWKNRDTLWIYLIGAGLLALTGFLYWDQFTPEWKGYQSEFHDLVAKKFGEQRCGDDSVRHSTGLGEGTQSH
jgi:hypothetical protein